MYIFQGFVANEFDLEKRGIFRRLELMDMQELRIGNLVYGNMRVLTIDSICPDGINLRAINTESGPVITWECGYIDLGPVPLTKGRLLKFGINTSKGNYFGPLSFIYSNGKFLLSSEDNELGFNYDEAIEIKHVHQLQNLYSDLTGEELTLKESVNA